jgi:hypothetical protein
MAYGKEKDDNENKGRKGKGPKKMKVKKESTRKAKKAYARSVSAGPKVMRKETLVSYKPNTDDNENIGRGGKGPKPMSRTRRAKASLMQLKDGLVSRFQSSTPKIGKNELMKPVLESLKPNIAGGKINPPVKKKVETKLTKGQKRSYELRDAHS